MKLLLIDDDDCDLDEFDLQHSYNLSKAKDREKLLHDIQYAVKVFTDTRETDEDDEPEPVVVKKKKSKKEQVSLVGKTVH